MNKFKINKIYMGNYKLFEDRNIDFNKADLIVLDGPNGYGKTSIFEAVEYLLTGNIKRAEQCPEVSGKLSYDTHFLAKDDTKKVTISGEFISEQGALKIERTIDVKNISGVQNNPKNLKSVTKTQIWFENTVVYDGMADDAENIIEKYLGSNLLEYYDSFYYISQEDRLKFLMASETKRMEQISSLFNIDNEINEYTKFNSFKNKLTKKVNKLKREYQAEKKEYEEYKANVQKNGTNKREYRDIFLKCEKKPYWNERIVKIKDKEKLDEILLDLRKVAMLSRNIQEFQVSLDNSQFDFYLKNLMLVKRLLVFNILREDIDNKKKQYKTFNYLLSLPVKENSEDIDVERVDFKALNENIGMDLNIDVTLQLQDEILKARKNQTTYNKSLEKLKNARGNLNKSLQQWKVDGGTAIDENVCPYCGQRYSSQKEYEVAIAEVTKTLEECNDSETEKIKQCLVKLQREYDEKFKNIINEFISQNSYMENDLISSIMTDIPAITEEYKKLTSLLQKQKINLEKYSVQLENENDWETKAQEFVKIINENYIKALPDEYLQIQNENSFFEIAKSVFEGKIENISIISVEDENEKRLYLEEQYQLQEHEKLEEMERNLSKKEKMTSELEKMKDNVDKVVTIYKDKIGMHQKEIIGEIQIPLYIYSGRVLQYYQGGLGIFIKYDIKGERLDSIRLLSSNQSDHDVLYTLSSGQLTGVIIALTLTLNKIYGTEKFSCILIDDPIQTMDDLNIASLVELLRNEFKDYQMIVSTHEEDFSRFIRYKYEKYNLETKRFQLNVEN